MEKVRQKKQAIQNYLEKRETNKRERLKEKAEVADKDYANLKETEGYQKKIKRTRDLRQKVREGSPSMFGGLGNGFIDSTGKDSGGGFGGFMGGNGGDMMGSSSFFGDEPTPRKRKTRKRTTQKKKRKRK